MERNICPSTSSISYIGQTNVLVIQASGCLLFPDEARLVFRIFNGVSGEGFQRHWSFELGVLGPVNHAHHTFPELLRNAVVRDGLA